MPRFLLSRNTDVKNMKLLIYCIEILQRSADPSMRDRQSEYLLAKSDTFSVNSLLQDQSQIGTFTKNFVFVPIFHLVRTSYRHEEVAHHQTYIGMNLIKQMKLSATSINQGSIFQL